MTHTHSRSRKWKLPIALLALLLVLLCVAAWVSSAWYFQDPVPGSAEERILEYAKEKGLFPGAYPQSMIDLLNRNPETEQFVLEYPIAKDTAPEANLEAYRNCDSVPLFLQWDPRWGYIRYGSDVAGITGCGPVCLSMAAVYATGDPKFSPAYMLSFAAEHNYYVPGSGSSWTLISEGGPKLGLQVTELPLDEGRILRALETGSSVICAMGAGDFTSTGHFIVITGIREGKFTVNDPNSRENSGKLWSYAQISSQIRNLWSVSAP